MIHQLLNLTRPLFVVDTETTGTDPKTDRIVEVCFQRWVAEGMNLEWRSLVNPDCTIPESAARIHGITNAAFKKCAKCGALLEGHPIGLSSEVAIADCIDPKAWPTFRHLATNLAYGFSDCDFAGKNIRFDLRIIAAEMKRAGVEWSYAEARIVDAERLEQLAVPRSLSHLHEKYAGKPHDGAHGALSDVRASSTVIVGQLETYPNLPRDLDKLHEAQWPGWLCDGGEFRMVNGVAMCQFGKHRGVAMQDIPSSYWDWILSADFSADVKALARAAKLGNFPREYS
jgi:DNA polymerase III subunit epsilon